jgi:hypothetical protein
MPTCEVDEVYVIINKFESLTVIGAWVGWDDVAHIL